MDYFIFYKIAVIIPLNKTILKGWVKTKKDKYKNQTKRDKNAQPGVMPFINIKHLVYINSYWNMLTKDAFSNKRLASSSLFNWV